MEQQRWMGLGCLALGAGVAASVLLGPLVLKVIEYRTAETGLNQLKGADLASLVAVAPVAMSAGALWLRGHPLAPIVSLAPSAYAVYTFTQLIIGEEYGRYDGNNELFFPLHLALVVLGGAIALRSWSEIDADALAAWQTDPAAAPHGGESIATLFERTREFLSSLQEGSTIAVTHASVMRAAVAIALDAPLLSFWKIDIAPLARATLNGDGGRWRLRSILD